MPMLPRYSLGGGPFQLQVNMMKVFTKCEASCECLVQMGRLFYVSEESKQMFSIILE